VADFAFPLEGNPSLNKPDARKIIPINSVSRPTACIPSINVFAIPDNETPTVTIPSEERPIPGVSRSQSVMIYNL
jgi:hypothetical protein